jgi:Flp pilus assembly protein CpaB
MFVAAGFARAAGASICPGDRVDLVAVISGRGDPVAYRLAVDLEVLELRDERGNQLTGGQSKAGIGGALLAVPEPLVEPIALAMSCGHVYMVVRGVMAHDDAAQAHLGDVTVK